MTIIRTQARRLSPMGVTAREIAGSINNIFAGRIGAAGEVTLTPSTTTTIVIDTRCTTNSAVVLEAMTANAAAERGGTALFVVPGNGSFVITHANNANTDRTFRYVVLT